MTTYTKRTNAKRAGIKAGIPEDQVEITVHKEKGEVRFGFKQKEAPAPAPAPTPVAPAVSTPAAAEASAAPAPVPATTAKPKKAPNALPKSPREERNGVKRPTAGGQCAAVWEALDQMRAAGTVPTPKDAKLWAESVGANANNACIELYQWRKFNGIKRETKKTA
jgi:hypothetical protein